jgi:hypothetical protein
VPAEANIFIGFALDALGGYVSLTTPYTVGDWVVVEVWWDGTTLHAQYNGAEEQTTPMASLSADPSLACYFREAHENGSEGVGEMAVAISFNRCLTDEERTQLRTGYLACRYPCLTGGAARRRSRVGLLK